jgi:hypothetical protein
VIPWLGRASRAKVAPGVAAFPSDRAAAVKRQNNGNVPDTGMILCTHAASSGQQNRTSGYPNRYDEWVFATGCQDGLPEQTSPA